MQGKGIIVATAVVAWVSSASLRIASAQEPTPVPEPSGEALQPADEAPDGAGPEKLPFDWIAGPATGDLGDYASIRVPEGYRFTDKKGTQFLMETMGNPVSNEEVGFLGPVDGDWFVVFEFEPIGYVNEEEKDDLNADDILASIKSGNETANEERNKRGWGTLEIVGWDTPPQYNSETKNLEWAVRAKSNQDNAFVVNHNTRILGRHGVMRVSLVIDPGAMEVTLPTYRQLMAGYDYKSGHRYAEFTKGDKVAEYGLIALVAGGAGAVAAKTGLLAKLGKGLWKLIAVAAVAVGGFVKKVFGKK